MEIIETHNGFGWTTTVPNQITMEFLHYISQIAHPAVLDISCGFGVATIPALETCANVIALDLCQSHLDAVREQAVQNGIGDRLIKVQGRFPTGLQFEDLTAIHSSQVLHFIAGKEIEGGARQMHAWLKPGGKVFIQVGTIYAGHIKQLVPQFEANVTRGIRWPREVENAKDFVPLEFREATPHFMNYLSGPPLVEAFESAGFQIEEAWYYTRTGLGAPFVNDGREHFGLIGRKQIAGRCRDQFDAEGMPSKGTCTPRGLPPSRSSAIFRSTSSRVLGNMH